MISDHLGGGAQVPRVDGEGIADPSNGTAHEQLVYGDAQRVAGPDDWLAVVGGGRKGRSWNPFGDLGGAQLNKVSTPIRRSTCTSPRLGGCGRRYRRSCDRGTGRRCGRLPKLCCA